MNIWKNQQGVGLTEYALIIGLVGVVVIGILLLMGSGIGDVFREVDEGMSGAVLSAGAGGKISFFDPFDPDAVSNWVEIGNRQWEKVNGRYLGGVNGGGEYRTFSGNSDWTDYVVELKAHLSKGDGYGVYFRATDPEAVNSYVFQYDPGYGPGAFLIRKVQNGKETAPIARADVPNYDWYGAERTITIEVSGDTFTASVDGTPVFENIQDSTFSQGAIGLRTWDSTNASFDDVKVMPLSP